MRTIGLLGGMSWESSALYYRLLNEAVRDRLGGFHSARCILLSVDFAGVQRLQAAGEWAAAGELLAADARALQDAGADLVLLCTNTMHTVADAVTGAIDVPFLHIGDTTAEAITAAGLTRVGLLGTGYTMAQPFLVDRLAAAGLEVLVPEQPDRDLVHRVIYDELVLGVVREESRRTYQEVVGRLVARGAQGVVLGCTEIELLIGPDDVPVPTFPTTALHAAAVRAALGEGPRCPPPLASSGRDPAAGRSSTSAAPPTIDR
ncbi:aspartate/glutamate racemase family protein [Blastococcus sp. KM273129]|uniref:aspartate/glutamate racemase family protein n=1 Tax=Blastococcus sp. KM273129 TaxID=2570315 RepID=UPI001F259BEC|nr:aspartate/glutamate racemase family protein [Blastococcus sp. KM273129]MCF6734243.1 aspartate/glutamate racemase family protein [Blastococcus sp. KM273129]